MASNFTIEPCEKEIIAKILNGINQFNLSQIPAVGNFWTPLEFIIKDEYSNVIAGILSGIGYWKGLEINLLWVDEGCRNRGLGTALLHHVESIAINIGGQISMLDTFDFQAEKFYLNNGYVPIGEIKDFPKGFRRIYFSKKLNQ